MVCADAQGAEGPLSFRQRAKLNSRKMPDSLSGKVLAAALSVQLYTGAMPLKAAERILLGDALEAALAMRLPMPAYRRCSHPCLESRHECLAVQLGVLRAMSKAPCCCRCLLQRP